MNESNNMSYLNSDKSLLIARNYSKSVIIQMMEKEKN